MLDNYILPSWNENQYYECTQNISQLIVSEKEYDTPNE